MGDYDREADYANDAYYDYLDEVSGDSEDLWPTTPDLKDVLPPEDIGKKEQ